MRKARVLAACFAAAASLLASPGAAQLERISSHDAASGLKAALERGSAAAVASLGRHDGFFGNPLVKIPLPDSVQRAERLMRRFGMGEQADELVLALNRAAETAVPEAGDLLLDSVRKTTLQDAKAILRGGDTAATQYFRRSTETQLRKRFLPIVQRATEKVELARHYNRYAERGAALGLMPSEEANLDHYVTQKTLDGLFFVLAQEEKKVREDPAAAGAAIIRRVFGALRR